MYINYMKKAIIIIAFALGMSSFAVSEKSSVALGSFTRGSKWSISFINGTASSFVIFSNTDLDFRKWDKKIFVFPLTNYMALYPEIVSLQSGHNLPSLVKQDLHTILCPHGFIATFIGRV